MTFFFVWVFFWGGVVLVWFVFNKNKQKLHGVKSCLGRLKLFLTSARIGSGLSWKSLHFGETDMFLKSKEIF